MFKRIALIIAIVLMVSGIGLSVAGFQAYNEVKRVTVAEQIRLTDDAPKIVGMKAGELVDTPAEAEAMAKIIKRHTDKATKGKTYAELDREDPAREIALTGDTLRTALYTTSLAFNISYLVMGLGLLIALTGAGIGASVRSHDTP